MTPTIRVLCADALTGLQQLADNSIQTIVTSPPYWGLRNYGIDGQLGAEDTPEEYVQRLVAVFHEAHRVLRRDGTLWLNLGDSYCGSMKGWSPSGYKYGASKQPSNVGSHMGKPIKDIPGLKNKDLVGIPWMTAFALRADGWYLRSDIIWAKPNPMPESVRDRPTRSHEYIFLLTRSRDYYYDHEAVKEPAVSDHPSGNGYHREGRLSFRNTDGTFRGDMKQWDGVGSKRHQRDVWTVNTKPYKGAHFATFPEKLITPCILAGSKPGDTVCDPFAGSGTTGKVALDHGRNAVLIELNAEYLPLIGERCGVSL